MVQSAAQQAQEDGALTGQVRREMWGNLQGILAMLTSQGCSPQVHDMVPQIAVHFANQQSQSVAFERRMTHNLNREKESHKSLQQQLQGGVQVNCSLIATTCDTALQCLQMFYTSQGWSVNTYEQSTEDCG